MIFISQGYIGVRKILTYRFLAVVMISLLLLQSNVSMAQWTADIIGSVKKEEDKKRMEGATITVKRNGVVWKTIIADARGRFEVPLLPEAVYIIVVSKPMHVTKRVEVSTKNIPAEDAKFGFEFPFEISLFEKKEGLDVSILDKPIAKIAFEPDFGTLEFDPAYTKSIKAQLDHLKKELEARLRAEAENKKLNQKSYDVAILAADKAFNTGKYEVAKPLYEKAAKIFPEETYPEFQLGDISDKLKVLEEANKRYKSAIVRADAAFKARNWSKATSEYETAAGLKATEQYPKDKIKEVKGIIDNEKKAEKEYVEAISSADQLLTAKDYEKSKTAYEKAEGLKSHEQYPKDKLTEIEGILAEITKKEAVEKAKEAKYQGLIASADNLLGSKDYAGAKVKYTTALGVKSTEKYPKDKLTEIEVLLAKIAREKAEAEAAKMAAGERDAKYDETIALANTAFDSENYEAAKSKLNEALGIKPSEQYPKDKLTEIEGILADLAKNKSAEDAANLAASQKEEKYNQAINLADKAFTAKSFDTAKGKYNEAITIKSSEQYPKAKLAEIEIILTKRSAEGAIAAESKRKKKEFFEVLIAEADGEFRKENYEGAKSKYNQALGVFTEDQYPKDKLKDIANILAGLKANSENAALAKKQLEENYKKMITQADAAFLDKNYKAAKSNYKQALNLKSSETYPRNQLTEIERIFSEIAAKESVITLKNNAQRQKEEVYASFIQRGDNQFSSKQFRIALSNYKQAIEIKPNESYPKGKVNEINKLLADLVATERANRLNTQAEKEKRAEYNKRIYNADRIFRLKDYEKAKNKYNEALGLFPSEQYPKEKIVEIDVLLNPNPKEDIITNNGDREKINDDNEREIEKRMPLMMGKSIDKNEKRLEKDKLDYNHQETIRITAGVERTIIANNEFEKYTIQEKEFLKKQDELNIEKTKAHHIYVDNLEEGDLLLKERSEELRASNRKEVKQIASASEKSKRRSRKMRKQKEVNVLELKSNVAKQEEIQLRALIGRTIQNENDIKRLAKDMNNMKLDRIDSYKDNVVEIAAFKEALNAVKAEKLKSAENDRQVNKKERDRVYEESRKDLKKQNKRYYKDIQKVDDFRNKVNKQDPLYRKGADKRRELSNFELTKEKNKLGEVTLVQKKKYEDFHLKLKEEQEINNNFLADLQLLEKDKILLANTTLNDVYRGENKLSENKALANKYSQGITEETLELGSSIVIKRTKVEENHVDIYERVFYKWGGSYFLKNGKNITQSLWDKESID